MYKRQVISITDGQIFLESSLFNAGIRPAINVGISVSRVGGAAQIKSMKKVAGTLKLDQAQFRELEAFAKFDSDLDATTQRTIDRGRKNQEILKQAQYSPAPVEQQIAALYASVSGYLDKVPTAQVQDFEKTYLEFLESRHENILHEISVGNWSDDVIHVLTEEAKVLIQEYSQK